MQVRDQDDRLSDWSDPRRFRVGLATWTACWIRRDRRYDPSVPVPGDGGEVDPDDRMLGHLSLFNFSEQSGRADIGYVLAREHWGQGFMREALTAAVDYAFGSMGLRRLEADTDPRNAASVRALERLGFAREGLMRERWQVGDEISDTLFMGLLAREWRERKIHLGLGCP